MKILGKNISTKFFLLVVIVLAVLLLAGNYIFLARITYSPDSKIIYGVTFSEKFAKQMQLDWQAAYLAMLDDLQVKYLRLPTYWDVIEPEKDIYNFNDIDWQIAEAQKREAKVILVLGRRQPRWPECHDPVWVEGLPEAEARAKVLANIELVVNRYKDNPAIEYWQVENEPFLNFFGNCQKTSKADLQQEIDLVKSLDSRKILITDSGELSAWYPAIKMGDLFGTTLYRVTWNKLIGYFEYFFLPPSYYRLKDYFWGRPLATAFIAELQAEPWFPKNPLETPLSDHYKTMNAAKLKANADYANKTNFSRAYFWGVEWWYWLKTTQGDASLWEQAKEILK